jgi:hypothetical protein
MRWQPIETAPVEERIILWCEDNRGRANASAVVFGRVVDLWDGNRKAYGEGMTGDWLFTHWMPLPEPPDAA